ncbi:protein of unknown function [Methylacidimicrobium sp. AP8]|nr:protein of unknown function [Methylacidimicrobium sp. AP8]
MEGTVGKEPVVAEGDAQPGGQEKRKEQRPLEPIDPVEERVRRRHGYRENQGGKEKETSRPIDALHSRFSSGRARRRIRSRDKEEAACLAISSSINGGKRKKRKPFFFIINRSTFRRIVYFHFPVRLDAEPGPTDARKEAAPVRTLKSEATQGCGVRPRALPCRPKRAISHAYRGFGAVRASSRFPASDIG